MMSREQVNEITKSLAFGMEPAEIAELEGVSAAEVERIAAECAAEIAEKREYMEGRFGDD